LTQDSFKRMFIKSTIPVFSKTVKNGAQTQIMLALDPDLENVTGKYYNDCKQTEVAEVARDDEMAAWLWQKSEE
jgi:retinol dehydrogenase 13